VVACALWRPMGRVLASQRITWPQMTVAVLVLPLHAGVATSCSGWVQLLGLTICVRIAGRGQTIWGGQGGAGWRTLAKLAYPSAAMRVLENWGFSGMVVASSLLPAATTETDVMSISLNLYATLFMIFPALSIATDTRVGRAVGAGATHDARRAFYVSAAISVPFALMCSLVTLLPGPRAIVEQILHVEELRPEVKDGLWSVFRIFGVFYYLDGAQTVLSGAIRGLGEQKNGAWICVVAYWVFGIPTAIVLAFPVGLAATGLWLGMTVGPSVQLLLYIRLLLRVDWQAAVSKCEARLNGGAATEAAQPSSGRGRTELQECEGAA